MAQLKPLDGTDVFLWKYLPSILAASIFLVLFAIITIAHYWRMAQTKSWFCIPLTVGGLFQILGYGTRVLSHYHTNQLAPYAVQSSFILLAPVFYAASIYMMLGRLIRSVHGDRFSIIRTTRMTKLFVLGDILSLTVQGNAAGLTFKRKTQQIGKYIVTAGLIIQLIVFGFFVVAVLVFHMRMLRSVVKESQSRLGVPWRQGLGMLYACSLLIVVRSIFRVIEYMMGMDAYLLSHEWPLYVFDAALMWTVQVIFVAWLPDKFGLGSSGEDGHVLMDHEPQNR